METTIKQVLTVGPIMANLLLSLRAVEHARDYYFAAFEAMGGETAAAAAIDEGGGLFDAVRDMLETEAIIEARNWAERSPETNEI